MLQISPVYHVESKVLEGSKARFGYKNPFRLGLTILTPGFRQARNPAIDISLPNA